MAEKGAEIQKEQPDRLKIFEAEAEFNSNNPWRAQARDLVEKAMGEKYKSLAWKVLQDIDDSAVKDYLERTRFIEIKNGVLTLKDHKKDLLKSFDVYGKMRDVIRENWQHDCEICKRRSRRRRIYEFRYTGFSEQMLRYYTRQNSAEMDEARAESDSAQNLGQRTAELQAEAAKTKNTERIKEINAKIKAERSDYLLGAQQNRPGEHDSTESVIQELRGLDRSTFESRWQFLDNGNEIDQLFAEKPKSETGYTVNPFLSQDWNHERVRLLTDNEKVSFKEITEELYEKRYGDFKKNLKEAKISDVVIALLDRKLSTWEIMTSTDDNRSRPDDLHATYIKLNKISVELDALNPEKIPDKYKALYPKRKEIKAVLQILGDYIAYSARLMGLIGSLKYNPNKPTADRERTMKEKDKNTEGHVLNTPRNQVMDALDSIFDVSHPREYTSEIRYLFTRDANMRRITFDDLYGNTATVETDNEWFTNYLFPDAAYKLAYEAAEKTRIENGKETYEIDPAAAVKNLNYMLQLGLSAYNAVPGAKSMKEIINDLHKAGVDIKYTMNLRADTINLFNALQIENINDVTNRSTARERALNAARTMFIRVGSVVNAKKMAEHQRGVETGAEHRGASIKLTEEQADEILARLRETGQFKKEEQLTNFKKIMIGGGLVVLPDKGGALALHYEFENGMHLNVTTAFPNWNSVAAGAGVGKSIQLTDSVTFTLTAGPGYSFAEGGGWILGAAGRLTKKFDSVDAYVEAGPAISLSRGGAVLFAGAGINWDRPQEKYEAALSKREAEEHITELEKSADPYREAKENPEKYPEMAEIVYKIEALGIADEAGKREMFRGCIELMHDGLKREAIDDSQKRWYEKFIPTGAGVGVAAIGGAVPAVYAYLEFNLWNRKLIYRVASPESEARNYTEAEATAAILAQEKGGEIVKNKEIISSGNITFDAKGNLLLSSVKIEELNTKDIFENFNKFGQFQEALARNARIFVNPADIDGKNFGLIELDPKEAHGNTEVYIDPKLGDDAVAVWRGSHLYVSLKSGKQIYVKREDITYPYNKSGEVERTVITVSADPHITQEVITETSAWYLHRTPTTEWVRRPCNPALTEQERARGKQENVKNWSEYMKWWGEGQEGRLEFMSMEGFHESYDNLVASVSAVQSRQETFVISPEFQSKIDALTLDKDFVQHYRELTTHGYEYITLKGIRLEPNASENFQTLIREINARVNPKSTDEYNAVLAALFVASIHKMQAEGATPEQIQKQRERNVNFHCRILKSIFKEHFTSAGKNETEAETLAENAANWILEQLKGTDPAAEGRPLREGEYFGTVAGMGKLPGIRRLISYNGDKAGLIGEKMLSLTVKDLAGEVARFWLQELSPIERGLWKKEIPSDSEENAQYQKQIQKALKNPLALKLMPLAAIAMTPDEMDGLTRMYKGLRGETATPLVTPENAPAIRKFLKMTEEVRDAQLAGKEKVQVKGELYIYIKTSVSHGQYKVCENVTGVVNENFALVDEGHKLVYFAGYSEGIVDVRVYREVKNFNIMLGLAIPLPKPSAGVKEKPPEEKIPPGKRPPPQSKHPPEETGKIPPGKTPTPEPTPKPQPEQAHTGGTAKEAGGGEIPPETEAGGGGE